jgi:hypothetical protein
MPDRSLVFELKSIWPTRESHQFTGQSLLLELKSPRGTRKKSIAGRPEYENVKKGSRPIHCFILNLTCNPFCAYRFQVKLLAKFLHL